MGQSRFLVLCSFSGVAVAMAMAAVWLSLWQRGEFFLCFEGVVPDGTYEVCSRTTGQSSVGECLQAIMGQSAAFREVLCTF